MSFKKSDLGYRLSFSRKICCKTQLGDNFTELLNEQKSTDLTKLKVWQKVKPVSSRKIEHFQEIDENQKRTKLRSILLGEERQAAEKYKTIETTIAAEKVWHLNYTRLNLKTYYTIHYFEHIPKKNTIGRYARGLDQEFQIKLDKDRILRYTGKFRKN